MTYFTKILRFGTLSEFLKLGKYGEKTCVHNINNFKEPAEKIETHSFLYSIWPCDGEKTCVQQPSAQDDNAWLTK